MRIGICEWVVPGDEKQAIEIAGKLGIEGVVINYNEALSDEATRQDLVECAKVSGVEIPTLAINTFCGLSMNIPDNFQEVKDIFDKAIAYAKSMGIKAIQVPHFYKSAIKSDGDLDQTIKCLKYACEIGEAADVLIGTENVFTLWQLKKVRDAVNSDSLKILFDTQNPWRMLNQDGPAIAKAIVEDIYEVHAKDSLLDGDNQKMFVQLGEGDVKYNESMEIIKASGFDNWVILESPYSEMSFEEEIIEDIKRIKLA